MTEWWQVVLLGVVEGLTEFLPVSSTGHLLVVSDLLRFPGSAGGTFEIFIQLGAVLAVIGHYAGEMRATARVAPLPFPAWRVALAVLVAFVPAAAAGFLLRDWIKQVLFTSPSVIAWSLIVGGVVFLAVERLPPRPTVTETVAGVSLPQALAIGLIQMTALVPGVSRSGAAIVGGMVSGLGRPAATRFAFYLAVPTLGAATLYDLAKSLPLLTADDAGRLAIGTLIAMVVAWASIRWLLRYVSRHSFVAFGVYRIVAGSVILALVQAGVL